MTKDNNNFNGAIIEESLVDPEVLKYVHITKTDILPVTERHRTPWVKQWTFHFIEVKEKDAESIAEKISKNLDPDHGWYADFKNDKIHYLIYRNKVFKMDRSKKKDYEEAIEYGEKIGIPDYQLDFSPYHKHLHFNP